jgi:phosphatidate cytidylyltransferase
MINKANLRKRLLFAGIAIPIAFVIVNSHVRLWTHTRYLFGLLGIDIGGGPVPEIYPGQILAIIVVAFGAYEYTKMLSAVYKANAFWLGYVWILIVCVTYLFNYPVPPTISNNVLLMLVAFEALSFGKDASQDRWKRMSLFFIGMVFLNIAAVGVMNLFRDSALFSPPTIPMANRLDVTLIITAVFMCDTAAYFVGSTWGKRRLSSISPNKTWEGSVAGLAAAVIVMTACWAVAGNRDYPFIMGPLIGVILGVTAQVGDLLMSLVKRYFHVKDASDIIPGHGGVLDRFDSLFFAASALYMFTWVVNLFARVMAKF